MRPFRDLPAGVLEWLQPEWGRRHYELRAGLETVEALTWESALGSLAWGRHTETAFSFKRAGFLRPYVTVRTPYSPADFARLHMDFGGGGTLVFGDGRWYDLVRWGFWSSQWGFRDAYGRFLCRFVPYFKLTRSGAWVSLDVPAAASPDLALLALLGWYAIRLHADEQAAAGASIATTSGVMLAAPR